MPPKQIITDDELADAFLGTNFGGADHKQLLNASVLKKAMGYHCGHTITRIMENLKLISKRSGSPTKRGRALLAEAYVHLTRDGG